MKEDLTQCLEELERLSEQPLIIQVVTLDPDGETLRNHVIGCSPEVLSAYKYASDAFIEPKPDTGELARSLVFQKPNAVVHQKVISAKRPCTRPPLQPHGDRYISEPVPMTERLKDIKRMDLRPGTHRTWTVSSLEKYFRDCLAEYLLDNDTSSATLIWLQNKINDDAIGSLFAVFRERSGKGRRKNQLALRRLSELLQSSIINHYTERLQRGARSSAVAAIMSRNLSHNIGSHVTPAASLDQIDRRMREQEPVASWWEGEPRYDCVADLKKRLDTYIQSRSDFLAEVATVPLVSTKPARFYSEVILPFAENTLLIDSIASGEGIRYRSDPAAHLSQSRLVLRVWVQLAGAAHPVELAVEPSTQREYGYPHGLPYTLRDSDGERLTRGIINKAEYDVRVGLPGPLGEHAMYAILENHIRNAAKHNRARLAQSGGDLEIHLLLQEGEDEATYSVTLSDNVSDACSSVRTVTGQEIPLHQALDDLLKKDLIDHHIDKTGWGLAEMKVCAALLRGLGNLQDREVTSGEIIYQRSLRVLSPAEAKEFHDLTLHENGMIPLAYRFYVRKARELCVVATTQDVAVELEGEYRKAGIELLRSLADLQQRVKPALGPSLSCELVLVSAACLDPGSSALDELLPYLPFRVVVARGTGGASPVFVGTHQPQEVVVVADGAPHWEQPQAALTWVWEAWLSRWSVSPKEPVQVHVYLEQECSEEPTALWLDAAEELNRGNHAVRLCVWGKDRHDEKVASCMSSGSVRLGHASAEVVYDRHGALCRGQGPAPLAFTNERRTLSLLEKRSADFNALFSQSPHSFPTLPWRLAEAGLLRVLVVDERLASRSMQGLAGPISADARNAAKGYMDLAGPGGYARLPNLRLWHAAWASNVYFCTRFSIASGEPGREMTVFDESTRPGAPQLEVVLTPAETRFSWNGGGTHGGAALAPDLLLIHKGVIDKSVDKTALRENGLPEYQRHTIINALLGTAPMVVVVSGRGDPHTFDPTLPERVRFMPFAMAESLLVDPVPAKLTLAQVNLSLQYTARKNGRSHP